MFQHPLPAPCPLPPAFSPSLTHTNFFHPHLECLHVSTAQGSPLCTSHQHKHKSHTSNPPPQRHMKRKHGHRTISPNIGDMKERSQHSHQYQSALRIRPLTSHADIPSSLHHKPTTTSINAACNLCIHNILLQLFLQVTNLKHIWNLKVVWI